jgi:hypothetical protein
MRSTLVYGEGGGPESPLIPGRFAQSPPKPVASSWTKADFTTPAVPAGATNISVGMGATGVGTLTMDDFGLFAN